MSAILFDLDGVLYEGDRAIEGAADTIAWFNSNNIPHLFLTNTSSRPRSALVDKLAAFGIPTSVDQFLTPPLAAAQWLKNNVSGPVALFTPKATMEEFSAFDICDSNSETAAAVVVGDMGSSWDFETLNRAFRLLMNDTETRLIALGMTRYWRTESGLQLDAGPFVTALQYATGKEPVVLGKPAPGFYHTALELLGTEPGVTVMIGDDIKGDIEAAQKSGLQTILVRTGKFSPADLDKGIEPDNVIDSVAGLVGWWEQNGL